MIRLQDSDVKHFWRTFSQERLYVYDTVVRHPFLGDFFNFARYYCGCSDTFKAPLQETFGTHFFARLLHAMAIHATLHHATNPRVCRGVVTLTSWSSAILGAIIRFLRDFSQISTFASKAPGANPLAQRIPKYKTHASQAIIPVT